MTSKQALEKLKDIAIYEENNNRCSDLGDCCDFKGELVEVYGEEVNAIERDLELFECFLNCFKSDILEATSNLNRRGDNIVADMLKDEFGLIALNKLKERLKNE